MAMAMVDGWTKVDNKFSHMSGLSGDENEPRFRHRLMQPHHLRGGTRTGQESSKAQSQTERLGWTFGPNLQWVEKVCVPHSVVHHFAESSNLFECVEERKKYSRNSLITFTRDSFRNISG